MEPVLIPKPLYGPLGVAGKGWRKIVSRAWKEGWESALKEVEWIDLRQSPGPIIYERAPGGILLRNQYKSSPFFASFLTRDILEKLEWKPQICRDNYFRLRDLHLEALAWPWYLFGTLDPHKAGLPFRGGVFPSGEAWEEEEKRVGLSALRRVMPHFDLIRKFEHRFSADGSCGIRDMLSLLSRSNNLSMYSQDSSMLGGRVAIVMSHMGQCRGVSKELFMEIVKLPALDAKARIIQWMESQESGGER